MAILDRKTEPPPARRELTGWAAIEDYIQRDDGGRMKDYADDIDTLLVFAGLFSAVLTAFVVVSYTMLQEDTGQTTNQLLATISSQLANTTAGSSAPLPPFTTASTSVFVPSTAARWINVLFFLSLVLSLAAALFGILAKQWLREYMQWNSPLGIPRDNVLIRQLRHEAFENWHVAATISSIPALLELAMIMFLVGLVIMLWTLDTVVAIVVTATTAVFLGIVSAFTVLPVIFKHCPYRSPTAWACLVLWHLLVDTVTFCVRSCTEYVRNLYQGWWQLSAVVVHWPRRPKNWRQREELTDRHDHPMSSQFDAPAELYRGIQRALAVEKAGMSEDGTVAELPDTSFTSVSTPAAALKDVFEVSVLFRALSWVCRASQDPLVREQVMLSMETIHAQQPENLNTCGISNVSDYCILWSLQTESLRQPQLALSNLEEPGILTVQRKVREMWLLHPTDILGKRLVSRARQRIQYGAVNLGVSPDYVPLFADLVAADLKAAVANLRATPYSRTRSHQVDSVYGRLVLELLCVMGCMCTSRALPIHDFHLEGIRSLVCEKENKHFIDHTFPGLRSSALLIACRISYLESKNGQLSVVARNERMGALDYSQLICDYYTGGMVDYDPEDLHIFVLLCNEWLLLVDWRMDSHRAPEYVKTIVNKMADAAEHTLHSNIPNCGCYFHLPWVARFWNVRAGHFQVAGDTSTPARLAYLRLFHALERLQEKELITGPDQEPLSRLVDIVHEGYSDCGDPDCKYTITPRPAVEQPVQTSSTAVSLYRAPIRPSLDLPYES